MEYEMHAARDMMKMAWDVHHLHASRILSSMNEMILQSAREGGTSAMIGMGELFMHDLIDNGCAAASMKIVNDVLVVHGYEIYMPEGIKSIDSTVIIRWDIACKNGDADV